MSLLPMYNGKAFSPMAALVNNISSSETVIEVTDISVFPSAPNFATIGIDENAETIEYSQIAGNTLSGCIRGIEGISKSWAADTPIARNWTNEDYLRLIENVESKVEKDQDGNADFIVFNDGDTFQEKFDNGDLVGQTGPQGIQGIDGKSVEIRNDATYIQWRNVGDTVWNNIIALIDLKGADGKSIEIQVASNYIQWRQTGGTWNDLISLDDLKGPKGDKGDFADINIDGILKGSSGVLVKAVAGTDYAMPMKPPIYIINTLSVSNWIGSSAPYTYTLSDSVITADSDILFSPASDINAAQLLEWAKCGIICYSQMNGSVTMRALINKPTIDIPVSMKVAEVS